jgi:hypothetical protein
VQAVKASVAAELRSLESELRHDAVAKFVLDTLRTEGMSDAQILQWCHPNVADISFEEAMQQQHGLQVSAAGVKYRVQQAIAGAAVVQ